MDVSIVELLIVFGVFVCLAILVAMVVTKIMKVARIIRRQNSREETATRE